jgi:hypothetical protein
MLFLRRSRRLPLAPDSQFPYTTDPPLTAMSEKPTEVIRNDKLTQHNCESDLRTSPKNSREAYK